MQDKRDRSFSNKPAERTAIRRYYEILRPKPQSEVSAIVTSHQPLFTRSHYYDRKSYLCTTDIEHPEQQTDCEFCLKGWGWRQKAYLCGIDMNTGKAVALELTDNAIRSNPLLTDDKVSLRGKIVKLKRAGKTDNAPVRATIQECYSATALKDLPQPFDLQEFIKDLWEVPTQTVFQFDSTK